MDCIALKSEGADVVRDANGVPVEWTLLKVGDNPIVQEGQDGNIALTADNMRSIMEYFGKKGEEIPIDSEHYLYELANLKKVDESEVIKLFPAGVAALGYGSLALSGEKLRIKAKWTPTAYDFLKEKIYKYYSPVLRGMDRGPLRLTSVTMTNEPAINHLDAIAASANKRPGVPGGKGTMGKLENALKHLLGRDSIALSAETKEDDKDAIACEVEAKASLIDQVKTLLGLEGGAGIEEIIAALKAETDKAKSADDKQVKLDEMAASAEKKAHADLVTKGRSEGKITDADMEYVNSLDSRALSAHIAHAGVKVPVGHIAPAAPARTDAIALSTGDRTAIEALTRAGIKDAQKLYLDRKNGKGND